MAVSDEHKAAMQQGRVEARHVRAYLNMLESAQPLVDATTPEKLEGRIASLADEIAATSDPAKRLELIQKRMDTEDALAAAEGAEDADQIESDFVAVALAYSQRKGISYSAWREIGVPASVLRAAGVPRTRRG